MNLFEYSEYKAFLRDRIHSMPKRGHGELQRIATALRTHTTRISHILRGDLHFTIEQACELSSYFGLNEIETEYFLALVQLERAGTQKLQRTIEKQLASIRERASQLVHRLPRDKVLSEEERGIFYSTWMYSAIRQACAIRELQNLDALTDRFDLSRDQVRKIVDFLMRTGLCEQNPDGTIRIGAKLTHLESTSPLAARHHANWRVKAMQRHERMTDHELAYTAPMSISAADQIVIREMSASFIEKVLKVVRASEPEEKLMCLNLDWIEI